MSIMNERISKEIYRAIADKHGMSIEELKNEMQKAIAAAYVFPSPEADEIPRKNAVPMVDEFINYAIGRLINEKNL